MWHGSTFRVLGERKSQHERVSNQCPLPRSPRSSLPFVFGPHTNQKPDLILSCLYWGKPESILGASWPPLFPTTERPASSQGPQEHRMSTRGDSLPLGLTSLQPPPRLLSSTNLVLPLASPVARVRAAAEILPLISRCRYTVCLEFRRLRPKDNCLPRFVTPACATSPGSVRQTLFISNDFTRNTLSL